MLGYLLIALLATTLGAMTGMGGGVIIKPVLDMLGHFDVKSISMLSTITVFSMATVSVLGQRKSGNRVKREIAIPLALGAVLGGLAGDRLMGGLTARAAGNMVTAIQNAILAVLIIFVFCYMRKKDTLPKLGWSSVPASALVGLVLGCISSFLGIGGGPINVALIIFVFSVNTKSAAACSLVAIWFSQASKLTATILTGGFGGYDLSMLPPMVIGAICGGFLGRRIQAGLTEQAVDRTFNGMQVLIFGLCIWNIVNNIWL